MQISDLGEFGLIDHLTSSIKLENDSTLRGIGDDCAVLDCSKQHRTVITTDMLMEGIHFDLVYTPFKHLGYKAAMVNLSDVYAMGCTPHQLLVSIAMDRRITVEALEDFYAGLRLACERHHVDIVGGDTTSSITGLAISITAIGSPTFGNKSEVPASPDRGGDHSWDEPILRSGAKDTDLICVSGNLGAAYLGLQLMEREKQIYLSQLREAESKAGSVRGSSAASLQFAPDFSGKEYLLERFLKPEARRDIIEALQKTGVHPTSMMDISDGLSSELLHICKASNCGCRLYEERIPIDYQTAVTAEEFNMNLYTCALNGGEDYELLFTVPLTDHDRVAAMDDVKIIGHITRPELGAQLVTRDGNEFPLQAQGWNHGEK